MLRRATLLLVLTTLAPPASAAEPGWIGARIAVAKSHVLRLLASSGQGMMIRAVDRRGPAAKAGLRRGDVLMAIDGAPIRSFRRLRRAVRAATPGRALMLRVIRRDRDDPRADRYGRVHLTVALRTARRPRRAP